MDNIIKERRFKILKINPDMIVNILNWCNNQSGKSLSIINNKEKLPEDTFVVSVHECWRIRTLNFLIVSKDFNSLSEGAKAPEFNPDHLTKIKIVENNV